MNAPMKTVTSCLTRSGALRSLFRLVALVLALCAGGVVSAAAVERVSVRPGGIQGNAPSSGPVISRVRPGQFAALDFCVAFYSDATNLVPHRQDSNAARDVFLFQSESGGLGRVSVATDGSQGNGASQAQGFRPAIDAECTCVAYSSDATNLVDGDGNGTTDVFVRDLAAGTTERVSGGGEANGASSFPSVDGNCVKVAFQSTASNLVAGDTNNVSDVFTYDRHEEITVRVSVGTSGEQADGGSFTPAISADGRCVAFASNATNLLPGDTNGTTDIYVACGGVVTCRASVDSNGREANNVSFLPVLNADGTLVAFKSLASNLVASDRNSAADVFVHDCVAGTTERVSVGNVNQEGNDNSFPPSISDDGRFVAFGSFASNLLLGQGTGGYAQIYVRDRDQGTTLLVSRSLSGRAGNGGAPDVPPSISPDGNFVAFASLASDMVAGDTNGLMDAFAGGAPCSNDDDCPPGSVCQDGECVLPPTPTPTPTLIACDGNEDCPPDLVCDPGSGVCVTPSPTPTPTETQTPIPCETDEDCPPGQTCQQGFCVPMTPTPTPRPTCTTDDECAVPCNDTGDCSRLPTPPERICVEEFCCLGDRCRSMRCVAPRPCENHGDCLTPEACIDNGVEACSGEGTEALCECGGDCNLDGVVFGSEISTAINVLAGVAPLSVCRAADIDGNGVVMGDEISLALSNLGQGCPDLLTPLSGMGQSRAEDVVTFAVGAAAGTPGETVDVGISVHGGRGEIVMAQLDLVFDPSALAIEDPETACRLDARLGQQALKATVPDNPPAPAAARRLRLFIGDLVLPVQAFGDGPVAACAFQIRAGAAGGDVVIAAEHLNASDANAGAFGTEWTDGAITVIPPTPVPVPTEVPTQPAPTATPVIPTATAPPPPPATPTIARGECSATSDCGTDRRRTCVDARCRCTGDCNGDGSTVVTELVTAVRILLGESPVGACSAADANGNGGLSIDEVLLGLNNLGRGCP